MEQGMRITDALAEEPFINSALGEKFLFSLNREDFSGQSSADLYQREFGDSLFKEGTYYFVMGTDSGLLPAYISSRGVPKGSHYLFIELPVVLERLKERRDGLDKRFHYCSVDTMDSALGELSDDGLIFYLVDQSYELIHSLAARNDYVHEYALLETDSNEKLNAFIWSNVIRPNEELHLINGIKNSQDSYLYGDCLRGVLSGITAVVLAAGPSLETFLPWVKLHRKDLLVIAVSRVCDYLYEQHITPDVVVHADPRDLSVDVAKGIFNFTDSLLAYPAAANPALVGQWPGDKVLVDQDSILEQAYPDAKSIQSYGVTVSNLAIDLAAYMGASRVILLGVDLCHGADGAMHARGSSDHTYPAIIVNMKKVSTNSGGYAYSIPDFIEAAKDLTRQARRLHLSGVSIINPYPGAMYIDGLEFCPQDRISLDPVELDVGEAIRVACRNSDQLDYLCRLEPVLMKNIDELCRLEERAKSALLSIKEAEVFDKLPTGEKQEKIQALFNDIIKSPSSQLANRISSKEIFIAFKSLQGGFESDRDKAIGQREYLNAYLVASGRLRQLLEETLGRVRCRKKELDGFSDIGAILDQWARDDHPGRSLMIGDQWLGSGMVGRESLARIEEMKRQFQAFLQVKDETYFTDVSQDEGLNNVIPRVVQLYKARDFEGFDYLLNTLDQYPEELALPYIGYARGMKAELEGDLQKAIVSYRLVLDDSDSSLLGSSLKRISAICLELGDYENAVYALESLVQISDYYAPDFADMLDAIGQPEDAAAVYEHYTGRHVNDVASLEKLALLYQKLGRDEEISSLLEIVEKVAPGSGVIQRLKGNQNQAT